MFYDLMVASLHHPTVTTVGKRVLARATVPTVRAASDEKDVK